MFRLKDKVKIVNGNSAYSGQEGEVCFIYGDNESFLVNLSNGLTRGFVVGELEAIENPSEIQQIANAVFAEKRKDDPMTPEQAYEFATGLFKAGVRFKEVRPNG